MMEHLGYLRHRAPCLSNGLISTRCPTRARNLSYVLAPSGRYTSYPKAQPRKAESALTRQRPTSAFVTRGAKVSLPSWALDQT